MGFWGTALYGQYVQTVKVQAQVDISKPDRARVDNILSSYIKAFTTTDQLKQVEAHLLTLEEPCFIYPEEATDALIVMVK